MGGQILGFVIKRHWKLWIGLGVKSREKREVFQIIFVTARQIIAASNGKDLGSIGIRKDYNKAAGLGNNREFVCQSANTWNMQSKP